MIKYIKGTQTWDPELQPDTKMRLVDVESPFENIWVRKSPDGTEAVLRNHALALYPFPSWGCVFPIKNNEISVVEFKKNYEPFVIHPSFWDDYVERKTFDEEGNFIVPRKVEPGPVDTSNIRLIPNE